MAGINYLDGSIYHMVHIDNLANIFRRRAILSKEKVLDEKIGYHSIAFEDVQGLRDRVYVRSMAKRTIRPLHSYVPFYFTTLTPMLYVQHINGIQNKIVYLEVSRLIMEDYGVLFTDGNASNQQLAKYGSETVLIAPIRDPDDSCRRSYSTRIPHGKNQNCSNFYASTNFLDRLNWEIINDRWFNEDEKRRIKHAEVLVPDVVPLGRVQGIYIRTEKMVRAINAIIDEQGLTGRIPSAIAKPELYFDN
jgi:hypothetical protein